MHSFANGIRLWIFIRRRDRFDVPKTERVLEGKTLELSPIVMDDSHGFRIPGKPSMLKTSSDMVTSLIKDTCDLNEVSGGVNACESEEFHNAMWC